MENFKNPYGDLGKYHTEGLDYVIANLPLSPTIDDLNSEVCKFIQEKLGYTKSTIESMELASIIPYAYNAYINSDYGSFNPRQYDLIDVLFLWIKENPIEQISNILSDFENNTMKSLNMNEQLPLLLCSSIALADYNYWIKKLTHPEAWELYFSSEFCINHSNLPFWVLASIQSTLFATCFGKSTYNIKEPPQISGPLMATTLTASIGITVGKVIFNWTPIIKLP